MQFVVHTTDDHTEPRQVSLFSHFRCDNTPRGESVRTATIHGDFDHPDRIGLCTVIRTIVLLDRRQRYVLFHLSSRRDAGSQKLSARYVLNFRLTRRRQSGENSERSGHYGDLRRALRDWHPVANAYNLRDTSAIATDNRKNRPVTETPATLVTPYANLAEESEMVAIHRQARYNHLRPECNELAPLINRRTIALQSYSFLH